jgi:hypothetical protein
MHSGVDATPTFVLRHSIVPYRTLGTFFLAVMVWGFVASYRSGKWGTFESAALVAGIYSLQIALGLWYQIGIRKGIIWRRAFGKPRESLELSDITSVGNVTSDTKTMAALNKPLRSVVIRGYAQGSPVTIDVSTKHFVTQDLHRLMQIIQEARPEIAVPKKWN